MVFTEKKVEDTTCVQGGDLWKDHKIETWQEREDIRCGVEHIPFPFVRYLERLPTLAHI
jgi:hypothetical protein